MNTVYNQWEVLFYVDGDEETDTAEWEFTDGTTTYYGLDDLTYADDNDGTNPLGEYVQVTSTTGTHQSGNYVLFGPFTSDSETFTISTDDGNDIGVTGFEVTPEPSTAALLALVGISLLARRRRD
jgi:hypothetical protein